MTSGQIVVVTVALGLALLAIIPRLPVPSFDRVVRENRWKREAASWRDGSGPREVLRTYHSNEEMETDRARLAGLGYEVVDEHWKLQDEERTEAMPSRDSMAAARLRALSRPRVRGPEITVTYVREPSSIC